MNHSILILKKSTLNEFLVSFMIIILYELVRIQDQKKNYKFNYSKWIFVANIFL